MSLNGKNIHTILKSFLEQKRSKVRGKGNFFLFFVFFFLTSLTIITTLESYWIDDSYKGELTESNLFVSFSEKNNNNKNNLVFANNNSVIAYSTPYFIDIQVLGTKQETARSGIVSYKVEEGDTLEGIALMFNISSDTIKWANSIKNNNINPSNELLILPTTGVLYYVERNDSLGIIAQKHKAKIDDIISFNDIEDEKMIKLGDSLIIPNGEPAPILAPQQSTVVYYAQFNSVTHGVVTQVPHSRHQNAVDIANACGTPIYAGSSGTVTKTGSDPALAGNYVWINHGTVNALYGHLQNIYVTPGEYVVTGQQIGLMGNTGYTIGATGCHLHFETRGGQNPFYYLKRGDRM
ncbi:MAG: peptidoglycan DD-metalloendopeptidase family protein [Patescibacteria group bacterium]|nr:peptidoglycan DD-metalloendopeptidase family protein [Patescibacteria group bacterium]